MSEPMTDAGTRAVLTALVSRYGPLRVDYHDVGQVYLDKLSDRLHVDIDNEGVTIRL